METTQCADCGSEFVALGGAPGYGTIDGRKICYACCAKIDREYMREHGRMTLYLTEKDGGPVVQNWDGALTIPVRGSRKSRHNFGGMRTDFWFSFEGQQWHGYQIGDNTEIAHCRRVKG